mgnify:CR=1 FL=1
MPTWTVRRVAAILFVLTTWQAAGYEARYDDHRAVWLKAAARQPFRALATEHPALNRRSENIQYPHARLPFALL